VKTKATEDGQQLTKWVLQAVIEKLEKKGASTPLIENALEGLGEKEKRAAKRYIRFLRTCPEEFRDAVTEITEIIERLQRQVCKR